MNKDSSIKAGRAIAGVMIRRYPLKIALTFAILLAACFIISIVLSISYSPWWLLIAFLVSLPLGIAALAFFLLQFVSQKILPRPLNKTESKQIHEFTKKFGAKMIAAKAVKKTPVGLASVIAWKYLRGGGKQSINATILEPIEEVKSLKTEFESISKLF